MADKRTVDYVARQVLERWAFAVGGVKVDLPVQLGDQTLIARFVLLRYGGTEHEGVYRWDKNTTQIGLSAALAIDLALAEQLVEHRRCGLADTLVAGPDVLNGCSEV